MQPKFTLKKIGLFFVLTPLIFAIFTLISGKINAQQYINGNLSTGATHVGTGTLAPAGTTWSELQGTNTGLGSGANITSSLTLADNFVVPAGPSWTLSKVTFFAYSTGFAGASSPFVDTRVQIFNTDPSVGNPTPIFGDLTTNRFLSSSLANIFRTGSASADQTRRVWKIEATVNTVLAPGTYWIEWAHGNGGLSNFSPASTVSGNPAPAGGNSKQRNFSTGLPGTWTNITDAGGPQDQYFFIDYFTSACTGTPAPGNTIASVGTVCSATNFNLSLQNATIGSGVTYQWQSASVAAGPYTNITGATNSTLTTTQVATTYYRCIVTCSGNSGTSAPVPVTLNAAINCYCTAGATSTSFEKISRVLFNTINNPSTSTAGYENFTSQTTTVIKGQTLPITVTLSGGFSTDETRVWIDFNQDGDFTDSGEEVFVSTQGVGPHTGNITISPTALTGSTRMRVRMHDTDPFSTPNATPCGNSGFGQVEDYTVNIQPCVQGAITTAPLNRSVQCSGGTTFTVAATGSALTYVWQYQTSATGAWLNVPNAAPYSTITSSTLTLSNVSTSMNGYQYRALVTGPCTATIFSAPGVLTVTPLIATVTPTAAAICAGSIQRITLTNASSPTTAVFTSASGLPLIVTDNDITGVSSTIVTSGIPAGAIPTDISITFTMPHTWVGDLVMNLTAPNGQTINLVAALNNGTGGNSSDNFTGTIISSNGITVLSGAPAPRTGTFRADAFTATIPTIAPTTTSLWSALQSTLNGNWRLSMCDLAGGDQGTLTSWSVSITYGSPATGVWTSVPAAPNTMFIDAAATVPYIPGSLANAIWVNPIVTTNYSVVYSTPTPCTSAPTVIPVSVVNPVTAIVNPIDKSVCVGGSTSFTASATGGPFTYQWELSTNSGASYTDITGATSATFSLTGVTQTMNNNLYRVKLSAPPCLGTTTTTAAKLIVNPLPVITISTPVTQLIPGRTSTITATSLTSATYSWIRDGVTVSGVTGNSIIADIDKLGTYRATVTDVNGCVASSNNLVIGTEASDRLWLYPNPTDGVFQVRLYFPNFNIPERREVSVWDASGQMVARKTLDFVRGMSPYSQVNFNLSNLSPGTYLVKATDNRTSRTVSGLIVIQ